LEIPNCKKSVLLTQGRRHGFPLYKASRAPATSDWSPGTREQRRTKLMEFIEKRRSATPPSSSALPGWHLELHVGVQ
jgi:hypothetical protein